MSLMYAHSLQIVVTCYLIKIKSEIDTSNFDKFEEEEPFYSEEVYKKKTRKVMLQLGLLLSNEWH